MNAVGDGRRLDTERRQRQACRELDGSVLCSGHVVVPQQPLETEERLVEGWLEVVSAVTCSPLVTVLSWKG